MCFINLNGSLAKSFSDILIKFFEKLKKTEIEKIAITILFLCIIGTFSGTPNGGIKLNRLSLFFINIKEEFNKFLYQYNLKGIEIIKKGSTQSELNSFYATLSFFMITIPVSILILNISGIDLKSGFFYVTAAISNTGEGLLVIGNVKEKFNTKYYFILNILMICGRFESIGYLLLFYKLFSRN